MAERNDIVALLQAACVGHPSARIPWPHRLLHDAIAEIGRLRSIVRINLLRHVPGATHASIDALLDVPEVANEVALRNALREIANLDASNCNWAPGMAARALAAATDDR